MTRKGRLWVGVTLLTVLAINYIIVGIPLIRKAWSVESRYKAAMMKQLKASGSLFTGSEDEYLVEIFRKERTAVGRNILILNTAALSFLIIIGSWTVFGLIFHKEK